MIRNFICEYCDEPFTSKKKGIRFCSNSCRAKGLNQIKNMFRDDGKPKNYRDDVIRNCKVCGKKLHHQNRTGHCKEHYMTDELRKRHSDNAKRLGFGGYKEGSGRGKGKWYVSPIAGRVYLDSSYEVRYAEYLDKNNIKWIRNTKRFPYIFENKERNYIPDFYLVEANEYIETKGYKTEQDKAKWSHFPHKLKVLFKEDLPV